MKCAACGRRLDTFRLLGGSWCGDAPLPNARRPTGLIWPSEVDGDERAKLRAAMDAGLRLYRCKCPRSRIVTSSAAIAVGCQSGETFTI